MIWWTSFHTTKGSNNTPKEEDIGQTERKFTTHITE